MTALWLVTSSGSYAIFFALDHNAYLNISSFNLIENAIMTLLGGKNHMLILRGEIHLLMIEKCQEFWVELLFYKDSLSKFPYQFSRIAPRKVTLRNTEEKLSLERILVIQKYKLNFISFFSMKPGSWLYNNPDRNSVSFCLFVLSLKAIFSIYHVFLYPNLSYAMYFMTILNLECYKRFTGRKKKSMSNCIRKKFSIFSS